MEISFGTIIHKEPEGENCPEFSEVQSGFDFQ